MVLPLAPWTTEAREEPRRGLLARLAAWLEARARRRTLALLDEIEAWLHDHPQTRAADYQRALAEWKAAERESGRPIVMPMPRPGPGRMVRS